MFSFQHIPNYFPFRYIPKMYFTDSACSFFKQYPSISLRLPSPSQLFPPLFYSEGLAVTWMLFAPSCSPWNNALKFHINLNDANSKTMLCKIVLKYHGKGTIWNSENSFQFLWSIQNAITDPEHQRREVHSKFSPLSDGHLYDTKVNRNSRWPLSLWIKHRGFLCVILVTVVTLFPTFIVLIVWHLFYPVIVPSKFI